MSSALAMPERVNPFPGLRPFEPDEDYLFFGRERQTDELLRRLGTTRFLSILGTSGSGKSSLIRSGLIPRLYGGGMTIAGSRWRVAIMRPGDDPLGNLATALAAPEALGDQGGKELSGAFFETTLRASRLGLAECVRLARIPPRDNVLVLIDQFEELFRYKRGRRVAGRDEAVAFVKLLLAAREAEAPIYIALTMRSDFIGDCMEFGGLPQVINDGVYLVSRMTRDELRSAITGPVAVGGATIAPRLVSRLLNDVGDDPDQLPILQHALMRTWDAWAADHQPGEPLDLRHYEEIGTMRTALSAHAEEAFAELGEDEKPVAETMFKALTDKESDVRGVRRPTSLGELRALTGAGAAGVIAVIDRFRRQGRTFLMPPAGTPLRDESIIDISHESLMRVWTRLSQWADEESRSAQLYIRVAHAAALHEQGVAALWRDPELQLALAWRASAKPTEAWAVRYDPSFGRAMAFLDASRDERDRAARERARLRRAALAILTVVTIVIAAFAVYAYQQKRRAEEQTSKAVAAERDARHQLDRAVTAEKTATTEKKHADEQRDAARRAESKAVQAREEAVTQRAEAVKQTTVAQEQTAIAQKQTAIASEERDKATKAQDVATEKAKEALDQKKNADEARVEAERLANLEKAHTLALQLAQNKSAYSRRDPAKALEAERLNRENGGRADDADIFNAMLLTLFDNTSLRLWMGSGTGSDMFRSLAIAPDGRTAFAGDDDGNLFTFDITKNESARKIVAFPGGVRALAARGNLLAIGTAKGSIVLRDLRDPGKNVRELDAGKDVISSLAFQPNGPLLAAGSFDGSVRLWNVDGPSSPPASAEPAGRLTRVYSVAFSADGKQLAAGTSNGAHLFDVAAAKWDGHPVCDHDTRSVALNADGSAIACGEAGGAIMQWVRGHRSGEPFGGHTSSVNSLRYGAGGDVLLSASSDGTVRLWDAHDHNLPPIVLSGHESWVWAATFASNGDRILSAGKEVRLWPANTRVLAAELCDDLRKKGRKCEEGR